MHFLCIVSLYYSLWRIRKGSLLNDIFVDEWNCRTKRTEEKNFPLLWTSIKKILHVSRFVSRCKLNSVNYLVYAVPFLSFNIGKENEISMKSLRTEQSALVFHYIGGFVIRKAKKSIAKTKIKTNEKHFFIRCGFIKIFCCLAKFLVVERQFIGYQLSSSKYCYCNYKTV